MFEELSKIKPKTKNEKLLYAAVETLWGVVKAQDKTIENYEARDLINDRTEKIKIMMLLED